MPDRASGLVIFAHGSGSGRCSVRNRRVADTLADRGFATLLLDLLTTREESLDFYTQQYRFDVERLSTRVVAATEWIARFPDLGHLPIGLFGASTGALPRVKAPTLFIVGSNDHPVVELNRHAMHQMTVHAELHSVTGATHLFEEPGALQAVERVAGNWFAKYRK